MSEPRSANVLGDAASAWSVTLAQMVLGVDAASMARWVGGTVSATGALELEAGDTEDIDKLDAVEAMSDVLAHEVAGEAIPVWFSHTSIECLGGRTFHEALDDGWDPRLLFDLTRYGLGHEALTQAVLDVAEGRVHELAKVSA